MKKVSIPLIENGTAQEVFDVVAKHLLTQGKRSEDADGVCQYRGPDGLMCAAGVLIPNDIYNSAFEGSSWLGLVQDFNFPSEYLDMIGLLQKLHDENDPELWSRRLANLATNVGLEFKP